MRLDIQGLRAVAVVLVVLDHAHVPPFSGGYIGVDVFFVISGFLITGQLLRTLEKRGRIDFADFYARRARRILPASIVVLLATLAAAALFTSPLTFAATARDAVWTALYVPNVLFALDGTDYLASTEPSLFQHYWSLGVEEQFYLVWPVVLMLGFVALRRSRRAVFALLCGLVAASLAASVVVTAWQQPWAFFLLPTRAWELGLGAVVAFLVADGRILRSARAATVAAWAGLAAIGVAALAYSDTTTFPGIAAALPVAGAALLIWAGSREGAPTLPARLLGTRPAVFVGEISYSTYLVHWPLLLIPAAALTTDGRLPLAATAALGVLSIPVAYLLHRTVEMPLRFARPLTARRPSATLVVALAATVLVAGTAVGAGVLDQRRSLTTGTAVAAGALQDPPRAAEAVPANLRPRLRTTVDDIASVYDDCHLDFEATQPKACLFGDPAGATLSVALLGDSHAAQWVPALERLVAEEGYHLASHSKSNCPAADIVKENLGSRYTACEQWRAAVVDLLNDASYDVVLLAGYRNGNVESDGAQEWNRGLAATIEALDAPTVVLADTPSWPFDPPTCITENVEDLAACALPPTDTLGSPEFLQAERDAVRGAGGTYLDLTGYLCSPTSCPPVIGRYGVYRDYNHLTATFARQLAGPLHAQLRGLDTPPRSSAALDHPAPAGGHRVSIRPPLTLRATQPPNEGAASTRPKSSSRRQMSSSPV